MFLGGLRRGPFEARYRAYPVAFLEKASAEEGDKVILPPSALDTLVSLQIEYPMLFKLDNLATERSTHCGVLEFVAEEGRVYLPFWMMQNLALEEGDIVNVRNVSLPKGTYVKLQPFTSDFLDITNPKAVLERTLRSYSCLTTGDVIVLKYNDRQYEIEIKETQPGHAISVIETDCNVDFEAPKDYVSPRAKPKVEPKNEDKIETDAQEPEPAPDMFLAFSGTAQRLDGKSVNVSGEPVRVPLYTGLTRYPPPDEKEETKKEPSSAKNGKNGKVVQGSGNRLLDKLQKDGKLPGATPSEPQKTEEQQPEAKDPKDDPENGSFKAFSGKSFKLK